MDFLLECIGFPPDTDLEDLARQLERRGEPVAWRGPLGRHLRLALGGGVEVRLDAEEGQDFASLWPFVHVRRRLRVAVRGLEELPDSPFDALLHGLANPPLPTAEDLGPDTLAEDWPLVCCIHDARRLPRSLPGGHVLAVSLCGLAVDISYIGPNEGVRDPYLLEEPCGAALLPLGGDDRPGGVMELSLRLRRVRHLSNPLTGEDFDLLEADAPGRPIDLLVSRWQLQAQNLPSPRPGWRVEGAFLFSGRIAGGLPPGGPHLARSFG